MFDSHERFSIPKIQGEIRRGASSCGRTTLAGTLFGMYLGSKPRDRYATSHCTTNPTMPTFSIPPSLFPVPGWDWAIDVRYFRFDVVRYHGAAWYLGVPTSIGEEPGIVAAWVQLGWVSDAAMPDVGTPGDCGDASHVAAVRTDVKGRVIAANAVAIRITITQVDGLADAIAALEAAHVPTDGLTIHYNGSGKLEVLGVPATGITGSVTDSQLAETYVKADGTRALGGDLSAGSHRVSHLADPAAAQDAATRNWVEGQIGALAPVARSGSAADLTGALPPAHGGTGLTVTGTANQVLGMNSSGIGLEYKSLAGTANQVTVSSGAGSLTLGLPQSIHSGASPQFAGMNVSGLSCSRPVRTDTAKNLVSSSYDLPATAMTGDIWFASTTSQISGLGIGANGQKMVVASGLPAWSTYPEPLSVAKGDLWVGSAAGAMSPLPIGSGVLGVSGGVPAWTLSPTLSGLNLTGLAASQFLRTDGSKNLVSGTIGTSDLPTIPVTGGGTGLTGLSLGDLWYGSAASTASRLGIGSSGQILSVVSGLPAWSSANTVPTAGTLGRLLYDNGSAATYSGAIGANQVHYSNSSQVPAGSAAFTFDGTRVLRVTNQSNSLSGIFQAGMGATFYPVANTVFGQVQFTVNQTTGASALQAYATENQDAAHLGTAFRVNVTKRGTTSSYTIFTFDSDGDVYMGALANVGATDGFFGLPIVSGKLTGSATRGSGATAFDSLNGCLSIHNGSSFGGVGTLATIFRSTGTSVTKTCDASDTYIWDDLGGSSSGATYTLPAATTGRRLTFISLAGNSAGQSTTIQRAGTDTIVSGSSTANASISMAANGSVRVLQADGNSKWIVVSSIGS